MSMNQLDGANAYAKALQSLQKNGDAGDVTSSGGNSAFASLVNDTLENVQDATANMEATTAKSLNGEADMVDVVTAISNAEMAVQTVVTVRDKVLQAYQEILRMPV